MTDLETLVREYQEARQMKGADERRGLACRALAAYPLPPNRLEPATPKRLETDLKPCPFCGKRATEWASSDVTGLDMMWAVGCENNGCAVNPHAVHKHLVYAIRQWNRRKG